MNIIEKVHANEKGKQKKIKTVNVSHICFVGSR